MQRGKTLKLAAAAAARGGAGVERLDKKRSFPVQKPPTKTPTDMLPTVRLPPAKILKSAGRAEIARAFAAGPRRPSSLRAAAPTAPMGDGTEMARATTTTAATAAAAAAMAKKTAAENSSRLRQ